MVVNLSPMAIEGDGTVTALWNQSPTNAHQRMYGGEIYLIRIAPGAVPRAILRLPFPIDERMLMSVAGGYSPVPFTFYTEFVTAGSGDRLGLSQTDFAPRDSGSSTVSLFTAKGDTVFTRRFAYRGVPVSKAAPDSAIASLAVVLKEAPPEEVRQVQKIAAEKMPSIQKSRDQLIPAFPNTQQAKFTPPSSPSSFGSSVAPRCCGESGLCGPSGRAS